MFLSFSSTDASPVLRTLAARKAFDSDLVITPTAAPPPPQAAAAAAAAAAAKEGKRFHPYDKPPTYDKSPSVLAAVRAAKPELTIEPAPPPPQDEPVDFSCKKRRRRSNDGRRQQQRQHQRTPPPPPPPSTDFASTREMRFARNLKLLLATVFRNHPVEAR